MKIRIYALTDENGEAGYIGQTQHPIEKRRREHISEAKISRGSGKKSSWILGVIGRGGEILVKELEVVDEKQAKNREGYWIQAYKSIGCDLANVISAREQHRGGARIVMDGLSEENLRKQYCKNGCTANEIGLQLGVSKSTVMERLKEYGVEVRNSRKWKKRSGRHLSDEKWLRDAYEVRGMSMDAIAVVANSSQRAVRDAMKRFSIEPRKLNQMGSVHRHLLLPMLEENGIAHKSMFTVKVRGTAFKVCEFLPYYRVFLEVLEPYKHGYSGGVHKAAAADEEKRAFLHANYPDVKIMYFLDDDFRDGTAELLVRAIRSGRSALVPLRIPGYDKEGFRRAVEGLPA